MVYNNSRKGAQGIGTLIIFIALILVAAVAAGVLISTVGKLQGKAETTGSQVQQKLGTGVVVFEVLANSTADGQITEKVDSISSSMQLSSGSEIIRLSDITVTLVSSKGAFSYKYNETNPEGSTTSFGVTYMSGPATPGYLGKEDTIAIHIIADTNISENSQFTLRIFPGAGNPLPVSIVTPMAMTDEFTVLK